MRRAAVATSVAVVALAVACNAIVGIDGFRLCDGGECGDAAAPSDAAPFEAGDANDASQKDASDAATSPPSCAGLAPTCGPNASDDCCASSLVVGGSFSLGLVDYGTMEAGTPTPATISSFRLDKYLVTIGRFRKFIAATESGWYPDAGSGKHVHLDGGQLVGEPGWHVSFGAIPTTQTDWDQNIGLAGGCQYVGQPYTDYSHTDIGLESSAINCIRWQLAYAFCIWDGGFLPTYAELDYAAAGGSDQRVYPWSSPADSGAIDWTLADYAQPQYTCTGDPLYDGGGHACSLGDLVRVGLKTGMGRWGQFDLAGYLDELTLDCEDPPDGSPCYDCVHDVICTLPKNRATHGGNFGDDSTGIRTDVRRVETTDDTGHSWMGFRCARTP